MPLWLNAAAPTALLSSLPQTNIVRSGNFVPIVLRIGDSNVTYLVPWTNFQVSADYEILSTALVATNNGALQNLTVNLRTNAVDLYLTNNATLTNYAGVASGVSANTTLFVTPQLVNRTITWPAAGNSYEGTRFYTNINYPLWTTLTSGVTYAISYTARGTNIHAAITAWQ